MLPLSLLQKAIGTTVAIHTKEGTHYSGVLTATDSQMNLMLQDATVHAKETGQTHAIASVFLKGCCIKTLSIADEVLEALRVQGVGEAGRDRSARGRGSRATGGSNGRGGSAGRGGAAGRGGSRGGASRGASRGGRGRRGSERGSGRGAARDSGASDARK